MPKVEFEYPKNLGSLVWFCKIVVPISGQKSFPFLRIPSQFQEGNSK